MPDSASSQATSSCATDSFSAYRTLRRFLAATAASPDAVAGLAFPDLIRSANAQGLLLGDWSAWRRFREMRTRTSHTYDSAVAEQVVAAIPDFLREVEHMLAELRRRQA